MRGAGRRLGWLPVAIILAACGGPLGGAAQHPSQPAGQLTLGPALAPAPPNIVYMHYYMWWTPAHWKDKLGPFYPYSARPSPLPGSVDASGCGPQTSYTGATIVDVPAGGLYDEGTAAAVDRQIATAAAAGISGFLLDWQGTGLQDQSVNSAPANARLDLVLGRIDAYNATHSQKFSAGLALAVYGEYDRAPARIKHDLEYFVSQYGEDPALANPYSTRPIVMLMASRRYLPTALPELSPLRSKLYLVGDETSASWPVDEPYLDAASYYWSSENPWSNRSAGHEITKLGQLVHSAGKRWFAPFIPGYDKELAGGMCVPRNGTQTLSKVWATNAASSPEGWFGISWNEYVENTYIEPSEAYGTVYLDQLATLIASASH
jgi:hypothetical protein